MRQKNMSVWKEAESIRGLEEKITEFEEKADRQ